ncbi:MAG TPA: ABC transporter ATP-binding protein [Burkholderiaceae bacterium]|nr:ABC transporter ATP-binding protein [Burkholderiaceae bacterium]
MLQLQGLAKRYGDTPVFDDVSLTAQPGEVVALLGDSGVGKSTLLNVIAGLDRSDAGTVRLDGVEPTALDERRQALWRRRAVGFVFQAFHVLPHLSVAQNVALPLLLLGRHDVRRVAAMLAAVGLHGLDDRMPRTLSGGQLQRVAIARALVHRPLLALADEPTGNLDPDTAALVLDVLLAQVRAQTAVCLLVTHSPVAAARADRILRLTPHGLHPA